jgi:hypothetical protein
VQVGISRQGMQEDGLSFQGLGIQYPQLVVLTKGNKAGEVMLGVEVFYLKNEMDSVWMPLRLTEKKAGPVIAVQGPLVEDVLLPLIDRVDTASEASHPPNRRSPSGRGPAGCHKPPGVISIHCVRAS